MSEIWNLSAICRCCHSDGHFKSLSRSYVVNNDVEIYSSMLRDTFGIIINAPAGDISFAICDLCINSLRRATQFKKQVLICEAKFEEYCKNEEAQQIQDDIKIEMSSIDGDDYELDRDDFHNGFEDTKCEIIPSEVKTEEKKLVKKEDIKQEDDDEEKKTTSVRQKKSKNNAIPVTRKYKNTEYFHESGGGFSCKICGKKYVYLQTMRKHLASTHQHEDVTCKICDKEFVNCKERTLHMATHKSNVYTCPHCEKTYPLNRKYSFKRHLNSHTKELTFECDYCNKTFLHRRSILNHIKSVHLGEKIRKVLCDICGHGFNDVTNMRKHVQTVHEKLRPYKCNLCPKDFASKKYLIVHERKHTGETPYACDSCNKSCTCSQELRKHTLTAHSAIKITFTCKLCKVEFNSRSTLKRHMKSHDGSKPLLCHICNKDFSCKYSLRRHISYHNSEKRFQCSVCLKKFTEKASLIRHNERFHSGKVVEKKQCHLCKRQVTNLDDHLAIHNEKAFSCEYCSKRYSKGNALNRHIANIHFGRKAHPCDLCEQKYVNLSTLLKHKLKVHKIESKIEKDDGADDCLT